jgi:ADP-heptose:LPS heptosyltransferase
VTMKRMDVLLGGIAVFIFAPFAGLINLIVKNKNKFKPQIVILKLLGGGSLMIAYPALLGIKKHFPTSRLVLVCTQEVAIYAQLLKIFDEIIIINKESFFKFISSVTYSLTRIIFSQYILNLELHSKLCTLYSILSLSKKRVGLYMAWNRWQKFYTNISIFYNPHSAIYIGYDYMAEAIGAKSFKWEEAIEIFSMHHFFTKSKNSADKVVAFAPFCSNLYKERQFDNDEWIYILKRYIPQKCEKLILIGSANDLSSASLLEDKIREKLEKITITNLVGKTTLFEVIALFKEIDLLITIDSGVNHVARLLKMKIISFWGPSNPALRLKNINKLTEAHYYKNIACSPCVHQIDTPPCNGNNKCMKQHLQSVNPEPSLWLVK